MPIRTKLLVAFLVLSLGPLAVVGFLAYESGRRALEDNLGAVFELRAARAIQTLDSETLAIRRSAEAWTDLELMQDVLHDDPDGRLSAFLIEQTRSAHDMALAVVVSPEGRVVAASRPEWLGQAVAIQAAEGLADGACLDEPLDASPGESPRLTCSTPIRAAFDEQRAIGRLIVTFDLGRLIDRLQVKEGTEIARLEMIFLRPDGLVIRAGQPDEATSIPDSTVLAGSRAAARAAQGRRGFLVERLGDRDHLVGYARSSGLTGWSALVGQETRHAFAPVYRLRLAILGFATLLAALVVALSFALARRVTSPILELTRAAGQVADGDLEPSLPPQSRDEIGALISRFTHMVDELRTQRAQLVEKDYLDSIFAHMVDGLIVVDTEGRLLTTNPALSRLVGRSEADLSGQAAGSLFLNGAASFAEQVLEPVSREGAVHEVQLELITAAGPSIPVSLSAGALQAGPSGDGAIVCILTDVAHRKKTEADLVRAREEAEAGAQAKAQFLATMSHEIRTPLNGIIGMTELLAESRLDPKQRDYAETAKRSGQALLAIVGDILDYSKLDAGRLELEMLEIDPRDCLEQVAEALAPRAREKNLELTVVCEPSLPERVRGDEGRLRQILLNLGSNAVKFTPQGQVVMRAGSDAHASSIRFEVVDSGIGISPEGRQRLFRPFSQVDASTTRKYGGTGLGLAISSQLVELMGGEIGVDSEPGRGSTFWVSIPMQAVERRAEAPDVKLSGLRVLVVDDNETSRHVLCEMLERWDCLPTSAADGWEALHILRSAADQKTSFDLALVDFQMPEMDGAQLAAEIKKDTRLASLPLLLLTSVPQQSETSRQMGFAGCLSKPVTGRALRPAMEACLGARDERPEKSTPPSPRAPGTRGRVLVVDDDAASRKVATELLERAGCRCDVVASGAAALEAIDREPYDLVFMDCHMPDLDGYETTRRIRAELDRQERLVIVAMTGAAFREDRARCLEAGMDDHVAKPVHMAEFERILTRFLPGEG